MDGQRFEDLTRGLATARTRRDVVKALFGGLFAGGVIAAQRGGAAAQTVCTDDTGCLEGEICCGGFCSASQCCLEDADRNARCPEGTACFEGQCDAVGEPIVCEDDSVCAEGEICCSGACRPISCCIDDPDPNARCAEGTTCNEGQCVPIEIPCSDDTGCAEGEICCANVCRAIECCIDEPDPNARCPEGTSCFEGICDPIVEPGACASDAECAAGEICCAGFCRAIECCIDEADPNARCAEGTSCFEGLCVPIDDSGQEPAPPAPVVQLPSTGTGAVADGKPAVLSAILTGGAALAAALGMRSLRKRPEDADA